MLQSPGNFELDDRIYRLLTDLIYANSGLRFDESSKYMLQRRLSARITELKLDSFQDYYFHLSYHPNREAELQNVFDLITTNESYFFREERQLQAFSDEIIPAMIEEKREQKVLRIWSAGCASGEEAYTIAMVCCGIPELKGWNIDIFGSDISHRVILSARRGIYGETAFRNMPESARALHFEKIENKYRVKDHVRKMVTFGKINLLDQEKTAIFNELDLIFCRNVIIYFDTDAKKRVIEIFHRSLRKNGYLLLGHSESLLSVSTKFKLVHLKHDMVYQK